MTPNSERNEFQRTWTPLEKSIPDERLDSEIMHLDTRFFIAPWLHRIQTLLKNQAH